MGTGGQTRTTHVANYISLIHVYALSDSFPKSTQVHVGCGIDTVVFNLHIITSSTLLVPHASYQTVTHRIHRCAGRGHIIHAMMRTPDFQDRMVAGVENPELILENLKGAFRKALRRLFPSSSKKLLTPPCSKGIPQKSVLL